MINNGTKGTNAIARSPIGLNATSVGRDPRLGGIYYATADVAEVAVIDLSAYPGATGTLKADAFEVGELTALVAGWHPSMISGCVACWSFGGLNGNNDRDYFGQYNLTAYPAAPNSPTWADHPPVIYPSGPHILAAPSTTRVPWHLFGGAAA